MYIYMYIYISVWTSFDNIVCKTPSSSTWGMLAKETSRCISPNDPIQFDHTFCYYVQIPLLSIF